MVSCDPDDLIENARCFNRCLTGTMEEAVQIYLLCTWANGGTPPLQDPPVPEQLFGARNSDSGATVGSNSSADGVSQINVYRSSIIGGPYSLVGDFDPNSTNQFVDAGLSNLENYYYVLRAVGDGVSYQAVESDDSDEICALMFPVLLQSGFITPNTAVVGWDFFAPDPGQDWEVWWSTYPDFNITEIDTKTITSEHFYQLNGLTPSTQYYFRVRGRNSDSCASPFGTTIFTTADPP